MDAKELIEKVKHLSTILEGSLTKETKEAVKSFYESLDENCWNYLLYSRSKIVATTAQELLDQIDDDKEREKYIEAIFSKVPSNLQKMVKEEILQNSLLYTLQPERFTFLIENYQD